MRLRSSVILVAAVALMASACGSSSSAEEESSVGDSGAEQAAGSQAAPEIVAGEVTGGSVEIDGVSIDYVISTPPGFTAGDEAPLLLAFPAGGQDLDLTRSLVEGTYAPEAQRLGWVVVSPAAPGGELFFQGSEQLVPGLLDWVETWVIPEGGAPHVAGISNGGISTFRYAAQNPDRVLSLSAFPGFPRSEDDQAALAQLVDVPIRLYVGGTDTNWISPAEQAANTFEALGGDVELTIFDGEGHIINATRDGVIVFEQLESFR